MKQHQRWYHIAVTIIACVLGLLGLANYIGDPSGLFRKDFSNQFILPNQQFIKIRYLIGHKNKYNCLIFGSSRINGIDGRHVRDCTCYNVTYAGGLPREHLNNLRYLLENNITIKTVLVGLDEFSYSVPPNFHLSNRLRYPYPPVMKEKVFPYYLAYLFSLFSKDTWKTIYEGYRDKWRGNGASKAIYDMYSTGNTFAPGIDETIEQDPGAHARAPGFFIPVGDQPAPVNVEGVLDDMLKIVELTRRRGIRLIVFVNPAYKLRYVHANQGAFLPFKKKLSVITDYYDFSGLNSITTNPYNYYESVHYRLKTGDLMIARMFGYKDTAVPADFGVHVTAGNADNHIRMLQNELKTR